jgi:ATP-dependent Clp protease adaptor protein ClpS
MQKQFIKFELENPESQLKPEIFENTEIDTAYRVFLFNDDIHSFDEVIIQLIKAIQCSFEQARTFAFEVHVKGKAMVFAGSMIDCLKVSSILEEIALHTQIVG